MRAEAAPAPRLGRVTFRLYDTATREVRDFVPLEEGKAGLYVCGLTVQSEPHVGHVRSGVNFDVLQRWLRHSGYDVTFIRNITDIDDKILVKAAEQGRPWYNLAYEMHRELDRAYAALNVAPPTYEPAATGHVPEMIELISELVAKGHAYAAEDGSGDVYFDVRSWPEYGQLTHQKIEDMEPAEDADPRGTRDPGVLLPGAVLVAATTVGMQAVSQFYLPGQIGRASELYGAIGATIVTLGWFFILGRVIVIALALNAVVYERLGSISQFVFSLPVLRILPRRSAWIRRFFGLDDERIAPP